MVIKNRKIGGRKQNTRVKGINLWTSGLSRPWPSARVSLRQLFFENILRRQKGKVACWCRYFNVFFELFNLSLSTSSSTQSAENERIECVNKSYFFGGSGRRTHSREEERSKREDCELIREREPSIHSKRGTLLREFRVLFWMKDHQQHDEIWDLELINDFVLRSARISWKYFSTASDRVYVLDIFFFFFQTHKQIPIDSRSTIMLHWNIIKKDIYKMEK